jgi:hypothetical protein
MKIATSICLLSALGFAACQAPAIRRAPEFNGDLVAAGHRQIAKAPAHDKNRWRLITAVHALKLGRHSEARALLATAMPSAGQILKADARTRLAQSLFSPENVKGFHGEPHERAMGWFYRGMFYWMDGEPDNARACFRTAQLMDALAAQPEHRADWVLLDYLDGFITTKLGRDGSAARTRAQANAGNTALPAYNAKANVMVFLQFGFGPMKKTGGDVGEKIVYDGGHSQARSARITVSGRTLIAPTFDNLTFQASTRGDRAMDAILANKAAIKKTGDLVGDIGVTAGAILASQPKTEDAGVALLGAGLVGKIIGGSAEPHADTRTWTNLPQHLSFATLQLPAGTHTVTIEFLDANGIALPDRQKNVSVTVQTGRDTVLFVAD